MKFLKIYFQLFTLLFFGNLFSQSVGVGSVQFVPSATLEVQGLSVLNTDYAFKVRNSALTDMLVIQNNGNVGINTSTPSEKLIVNGNCHVLGHGSVGPYTAPDVNTVLNSYDLFLTGSASYKRGIYSQLVIVPLGVNQTGDIIGISNQVDVSLLLNSTLSNVYGIYNIMGLAGGAGTVTNAFGYYQGAIPIVASTVTNLYGIYLENITGATNNYSIYSAGGKNYFAGDIGIGTAGPTSSLQVNGSLSLAIVSKTAAYTLTAADHTILADATTAGFTLTLPTAVGISGRVYVIKKTDATANFVVVQTTSAQTIDGAAPPLNIAAANSRILVQSDGANWFRID